MATPTTALKMITGKGGPTSPSGVGLASMCQRAAELGGSLSAGPEPRGGRVVAVLPVRS
ncbi:MAG: hypothetical protein KDC40_04975 [Actinobacteria bacterium]|nr:hypothetical protein [Actinomycetota bacterium]